MKVGKGCKRHVGQFRQFIATFRSTRVSFHFFGRVVSVRARVERERASNGASNEEQPTTGFHAEGT